MCLGYAAANCGSKDVRHWEVLVGDSLCSCCWISRAFAFSKERMHFDAEFHIFYLSGEHVINLCMATHPIHLQSCMGRAIPSFMVRKCYLFVLSGKRVRNMQTLWRNTAKALPFGKMERQSPACLFLDSPRYWLPFPPAFPSSPPVQDWQGRLFQLGKSLKLVMQFALCYSNCISEHLTSCSV